jgi:hypothetical protein
MVFTSADPSFLSPAIEAAMSLMAPIEWACVRLGYGCMAGGG